MDIHRREAGLVEGCRHFHLTVDALLAQDGDARARAVGEKRRDDILGGIEGQPHAQAWIGGIASRLERLAGAVRMIAQRLQPITGLRPESTQFGAAGGERGLPSEA